MAFLCTPVWFQIPVLIKKIIILKLQSKHQPFLDCDLFDDFNAKAQPFIVFSGQAAVEFSTLQWMSWDALEGGPGYM